MQRMRESRCDLQFGRQWSRAADHCLGDMSTTCEKRDYSLRNFPPDLQAVLGIPVLITLTFFSWLLSVHGTTCICAAAASFGIGVLGAALLFLAKLPLYRQGRFFTFGIKVLPESSHTLYRWGCRCSMTGCLLMFLLWLGSTVWR